MAKLAARCVSLLDWVSSPPPLLARILSVDGVVCGSFDEIGIG